jgi:hypothetical protein
LRLYLNIKYTLYKIHNNSIRASSTNMPTFYKKVNEKKTIGSVHEETLPVETLSALWPRREGGLAAAQAVPGGSAVFGAWRCGGERVVGVL